MHKPAGITATVADRHAAPAPDLAPARPPAARGQALPGGGCRHSEGLLLLTSDGRGLGPRAEPHGVELEHGRRRSPCSLTGSSRPPGPWARRHPMRRGHARLGSLRAPRPEPEHVSPLADRAAGRGLAWGLGDAGPALAPAGPQVGAVGAPRGSPSASSGPFGGPGLGRRPSAHPWHRKVRGFGASTYQPETAGARGTRGTP